MSSLGEKLKSDIKAHEKEIKKFDALLSHPDYDTRENAKRRIEYHQAGIDRANTHLIR